MAIDIELDRRTLPDSVGHAERANDSVSIELQDVENYGGVDSPAFSANDGFDLLMPVQNWRCDSAASASMESLGRLTIGVSSLGHG